jgi:hypothetical protein
MSHPAGRNHLNLAFRSPLMQQLVAQSLANSATTSRDGDSTSGGAGRHASVSSSSPSSASYRTTRAVEEEESSASLASSSSSSYYASPIPQYRASASARLRHRGLHKLSSSSASSFPKAKPTGPSVEGRTSDAGCVSKEADELQDMLQSLNIFSDMEGATTASARSSSLQRRKSHDTRHLFNQNQILYGMGQHTQVTGARAFSSSTLLEGDEEDEENQASTVETSNDRTVAFQNLLITRRTTSNYQPLEGDKHEKQEKLLKLQAAIQRAVECAVQAPNHKLTEPYTFKTLTAMGGGGSNTRDDMLNLLEKHIQFKKGGDAKAGMYKKEKWSQVPAFVVALCGNQPDQGDETWRSSTKEHKERAAYDEMPFVAPSTLRQVEDVSIALQHCCSHLWILHSARDSYSSYAVLTTA